MVILEIPSVHAPAHFPVLRVIKNVSLARFWTGLTSISRSPRVEIERLTSTPEGEPSAIIRDRVEDARVKQRSRYHGSSLTCNADIGPGEIQAFCELDTSSADLIRHAVQQLQLSARGYHRVLKLARTIADLADEAKIQQPHLAEALQYRPRRWA